MEFLFFLEMLLTALLAFLCSFLLANLFSSANDPSSKKPEIIGTVGDEFVTEDVRSVKKMDARVMESDKNLSVVADENVELVDRFLNGADGAGEVEDAATGDADIRGGREEELVVFTAETESTAVLSPENNAIVEEEMISRGVQEEKSDSADEIAAGREEADEYSGSVSPEEKIVLQEREDRSESTELGRSGCVENEERRGDVVVAEVEDEVRVEETNTVSETESDTEGADEADEEKEELSIEEDDDDDDWEGIERSELEKSFAVAANLLEESGKLEDIGAEAKMDLYGLHKIATEGPCREAQPMAVMVSARAKWNAWQKLGNMSQEDAMEQYLALVSKELPGLMTVGKMSEIETSVCSPPNSGSLEDPTNLDTTAVDDSSKMGKSETSG